MAAFDFAVMPRCPWTNQFMVYPKLITQKIKGVCTRIRFCISEFKAVVSLNRFRFVTEVCDCPSYEIIGTVAALFDVRIKESLSRRFIDHRVLIELLMYFPDIASSWNMLYIHLPFQAQACWRIVPHRLPFLLG